MKRRTVRLLFLLTALVLLGENQARAEFVDYSYSWTVQPSAVIPGGTGSVTFAVVPDGTASSELGSATPTLLPGANITTTSSAVEVPDTFNSSLGMKLTLTDTASSSSGSLTFTGSITGTLTALQSNLLTTFSGPLTQTLTLGNHVYSVTIDPTTVSMPTPGSASQALVDALVTVSAASMPPPPPPPPPTPHQTPEPSSLLLGMTAMAGLAARRFLRRNRPV